MSGVPGQRGSVRLQGSVDGLAMRESVVEWLRSYLHVEEFKPTLEAALQEGQLLVALVNAIKSQRGEEPVKVRFGKLKIQQNIAATAAVGHLILVCKDYGLRPHEVFQVGDLLDDKPKFSYVFQTLHLLSGKLASGNAPSPARSTGTSPGTSRPGSAGTGKTAAAAAAPAPTQPPVAQAPAKEAAAAPAPAPEPVAAVEPEPKAAAVEVPPERRPSSTTIAAPPPLVLNDSSERLPISKAAADPAPQDAAVAAVSAAASAETAQRHNNAVRRIRERIAAPNSRLSAAVHAALYSIAVSTANENIEMALREALSADEASPDMVRMRSRLSFMLDEALADGPDGISRVAFEIGDHLARSRKSSASTGNSAAGNGQTSGHSSGHSSGQTTPTNTVPERTVRPAFPKDNARLLDRPRVRSRLSTVFDDAMSSEPLPQQPQPAAQQQQDEGGSYSSSSDDESPRTPELPSERPLSEVMNAVAPAAAATTAAPVAETAPAPAPAAAAAAPAPATPAVLPSEVRARLLTDDLVLSESDAEPVFELSDVDDSALWSDDGGGGGGDGDDGAHSLGSEESSSDSELVFKPPAGGTAAPTPGAIAAPAPAAAGAAAGAAASTGTPSMAAVMAASDMDAAVARAGEVEELRGKLLKQNRITAGLRAMAALYRDGSHEHTAVLQQLEDSSALSAFWSRRITALQRPRPTLQAAQAAQIARAAQEAQQ